MITYINASAFQAVPYLETSALMKNHPTGLHFSIDKPNVIVGPNGSGKSALLTTLAILTQTFYDPFSRGNRSYLSTEPKRGYWKERGYGDWEFLPGLEVASDHAPAVYYRPNHVPGNEASPIYAMAREGYMARAKEYLAKTRDKSSGQQHLALLDDVFAILCNEADVPAHDLHCYEAAAAQWVADGCPRYATAWSSIRPKILCELFSAEAGKSLPMVIIDEGEASLDALAEADMWRKIVHADTSRIQLVVATHSLYPLLYPKKFNLIEAVPGYVQAVRNELGL